ncbi:MAG TPA: pilus assembly protein TadG-related protein [Anaerolineales bacterium]|nr:pilus assembly protein TadG-related protein [Anaerolineales bacterium]
MKNHTDGQRGQVLVLVALVLVLLMGFAGLALDGGNIYTDRRSAQAAADTAALSGALAVVQGYGSYQVGEIARYRAGENGYIDSSTMTVEVYWPPISPHPYAGDPAYVQVLITHQLETIFAHFFYDGPFIHTVEAVAHARVNEDLLPGYAIYADNPMACPGVEFDGTPGTIVRGGGSILSNSTRSCTCGASGAAGVTRGTGSVQVVDPLGRAGIFSVGCWKQMGSTFISVPPPQGNAGQEAVDAPPLPDCSGLPDHRSEGDKVFNGAATIAPGRYDSLWVTGHGALTMQPGIYCLSGRLQSVSPHLAFQIDAQGMVNGTDVMIYLESGGGGLRSAGSSTSTLLAGDPSGAGVAELVDASGEDWRGMLLYVHPNNTNVVHLSGGSDSTYTGTIYAPGSHCTVQGNGAALALNTQMICDTVRITGTGDIDVNYDPARNYHQKNGVELFH